MGFTIRSNSTEDPVTCLWPSQMMQPLLNVERREAATSSDIKPAATSGASDGPERLLPTLTAGSGSGSAGTSVVLVQVLALKDVFEACCATVGHDCIRVYHT